MGDGRIYMYQYTTCTCTCVVYVQMHVRVHVHCTLINCVYIPVIVYNIMCYVSAGTNRVDPSKEKVLLFFTCIYMYMCSYII